MVPTRTVSFAKLQSDHQPPEYNTQFLRLDALPAAKPTVSKPQRQIKLEVCALCGDADPR